MIKRARAGSSTGRPTARTSCGTWSSRPTSAARIAAELGVDPQLVKRCALMHDIGKAVTHEVEGSHALIGAELARRLKEPPEVVHAIESHHGEVEQRTIEAVLAQIGRRDLRAAGRAPAASRSRPT